jgi:single-strand DNA-binding protein
MNLNKVFLIGRVTKQPEQRAMPSGSYITTFSLATNRVWKGQDGQKNEETEFHNLTAFGKTAETIATYVVKGQEIMVEGRIHTDAWQDKSGNKRYSTGIIVESFQFGQKPAGAQRQEADQNYKAPKVEESEIPVIEEGDAPQDMEMP